MDAKKHERAKGILKDLVADFLERISNRTSLITVTGLEVTDNEKEATILISVLPDHQAPAAVDFIGRNLTELRQYIMKKSKLRSVPYFRVMLDLGEKNRQLIDTLSLDAKKKTR